MGIFWQIGAIFFFALGFMKMLKGEDSIGDMAFSLACSAHAAIARSEKK